MAPKRKSNTLDPEPGMSFFCRMQKSEEDIPILPTNVLGGEGHLRRTLNILRRREEEMSPFKIAVGTYSVHVTPLPNPLSSHHILQLYSGRTPFCLVDMLIEDASLYFTAFRLHVLKKTKQTRDTPLGPGRWKVFKDQLDSLPHFLRSNADPIDFDSSYGSITIEVGGSRDFMQEEVFDEFVKFAANAGGLVSTQFKRAAYAAMVIYCETRRSLGMLDEIGKRNSQRHNPGPLPPLQDKTKNMWGTFSGEALRAKRDGRLEAWTLLGRACYHGVLNYRQLSHLIGANGELLIAKQDQQLLCGHVTEAVFEDEAKKAKVQGQFRNVKFQIPDGFVPEWLLRPVVAPLPL